jgi:hypothetical protein
LYTAERWTLRPRPGSIITVTDSLQGASPVAQGGVSPARAPVAPPTAHALSQVLAQQGQILAEMRRMRAHVPVRHGWLKIVVKDLETNPHQQYSVHKWGMYYWLANFPAITLLFFLAPGLWLELGIFITLIYSVYANFSTDYAGMSAAMAAYGSTPLPAIPLEPPAAGFPAARG